MAHSGVQHEPRPTHDATGVIVPLRLREIFRGRNRVFKIVEELEVVQHNLHALKDMEYCSQMNMAEVLRDFKRLRLRIAQGLPFSPCQCRANAVCEICKGRKWVNATQYLLLPHPGLGAM